MICDLKRPKFWRDEEGATNFRSLLSRMDSGKLALCYQKIEVIVTKCEAYVRTWLSYQALWDMDMGAVFDGLGDDIGKWCKLITDMKKQQKTFDQIDALKTFEPVMIQYGSVANKVNNKFYNFRKETFLKLCDRLGEILASFLE